MRINRRNLDDFNHALEILNKNLDGQDAQDMTFTEMERVITSVYGVLTEWGHLSSDIDDWLNILEDIEEK